MPKLVILSGRYRSKKLNLPTKNKTLVVGRGEECALRLASTDVSREHCTIRTEDGRVFVNDLGSGNGTQINDMDLTSETELLPGQFLKIGPMLFQLLDPNQEAAAIPDLDEPEPPAETDSHVQGLLAAEAAGQSSSETTIVDKQQLLAAAKQIPYPPASRTSFDSVAEEAADIIRRHLEWKSQVNSLK